MIDENISYKEQAFNTKPYLSRIIFSFMVFTAMLGYVPGLPFWTYNISISIIVPALSFLLIIRKGNIITKDEVIFLFVFISSILASYLFSAFGFNPTGFLRAIVPILFYYLIRVLKIPKNKFYYNFIFFLLISSFIVGVYQFLFQPQYSLAEGGEWVNVSDDVLPLLKRPVSYLGNPNIFGVITVFFFIILYIENNRNINLTKKIFIVIMVLCNIILFSKSRTSLLAFILILLFYNLRLKNYKTLLVIFLTFFLLFAYVVVNYEKFEVLDQLFRLSDLSDKQDNSYTLRRDIAEFSMNIISQRPIFGIGPGNEKALMLTLNAPHKGMESATLFLLEERGIIGYLIYLYILSTKFLFARNNFAKILIGIVMISVDFTETVCVIQQLATFLAVYLAISENDVMYKHLN